jgi:hypothetical protein
MSSVIRVQKKDSAQNAVVTKNNKSLEMAKERFLLRKQKRDNAQ